MSAGPEPSIELRIAPDGTVSAVTHGVHGPACLPWIEAVAGLTQAQVVDSHFTEDFHREPPVEVRPDAEVRVEARRTP